MHKRLRLFWVETGFADVSEVWTVSVRAAQSGSCFNNISASNLELSPQWEGDAAGAGSDPFGSHSDSIPAKNQMRLKKDQNNFLSVGVFTVLHFNITFGFL